MKNINKKIELLVELQKGNSIVFIFCLILSMVLFITGKTSVLGIMIIIAIINIIIAWKLESKISFLENTKRTAEHKERIEKHRSVKHYNPYVYDKMYNNDETVYQDFYTVTQENRTVFQENQTMNQEIDNWMIREAEKQVTPFEMGGYDMTHGNSFNDFF